jgi:hypothetical protein
VRRAGLRPADHPGRHRPPGPLLRRQLPPSRSPGPRPGRGRSADRAARLAEAKAITDRLWRPLEAAGFRDVAEHAALVASCAADSGRPHHELDQAITGLHQAAAALAGLARQYREASDLARELTERS